MDGYDDASQTLCWDFHKGGSTAELLRLLREYAGILRQLRVAYVRAFPHISFMNVESNSSVTTSTPLVGTWVTASRPCLL